MHTIYSLSSAKHGVFYVGKTSQPLHKRLICHFSDANCKVKSTNKDKDEIILDCSINGIAVKIKKLDACNEVNYATLFENYWICKLIGNGHKLTNKYQINGKVGSIYHYPAKAKKLVKVCLTKKEHSIIINKRTPFDTVKLSKITGYTPEMMRICIRDRRMRIEIYKAIKKFYKLPERNIKQSNNQKRKHD